VRELEILSARMIRAGFAGDYHSAFHGRGIEFSQVREYQPGDDIRTIDWNVTARSGVPHVKQFVEERDLTVILAVDVSQSMGFGSVDWRKADIAAELVSVFAFSAVANADRVVLLLFADRMRQYIPPRRGRAHAQVIVRAAADAAMRPASEVRTSKFEILPRLTDSRNDQRHVILLRGPGAESLNALEDRVTDLLGARRGIESGDEGLQRVQTVGSFRSATWIGSRTPSGGAKSSMETTAPSARRRTIGGCPALAMVAVPAARSKRMMAAVVSMRRRVACATTSWRRRSTAPGFDNSPRSRVNPARSEERTIPLARP